MIDLSLMRGVWVDAEGAHGARAGRLHAGRRRPRDPAARPGRGAGLRLGDRHRRPDGRRRLRLPDAPLRLDLRQPGVDGGRDRRRQGAARVGRRERRAVLGAARRRRQLRHRHLVRVQALPGRARDPGRRRSRGAARTPARCSTSTASSPPRRRASSPAWRCCASRRPRPGCRRRSTASRSSPSSSATPARIEDGREAAGAACARSASRSPTSSRAGPTRRCRACSTPPSPRAGATTGSRTTWPKSTPQVHRAGRRACRAASRRRTRRSSSSSSAARSNELPAGPLAGRQPRRGLRAQHRRLVGEGGRRRGERRAGRATASRPCAPYSTGGTYINFLTEEEGRERIEAAYGRANLERLARSSGSTTRRTCSATRRACWGSGMSPHPSPIRLLAAALPDLAAEARARAASSRTCRKLAPDFVDKLARAGAFRILVPADAGGLGASLPRMAGDHDDAGARPTPRQGGCAAHANICAGIIHASADPRFNEEFFADPRACAAWSNLPRVKVKELDEGMRISGSWGFESGCTAATFVGGMVVLPPLAQGAPPRMVAALAPVGEATIEETWDPDRPGRHGQPRRAFRRCVRALASHLPVAVRHPGVAAIRRRCSFPGTWFIAIGAAATHLGLARTSARRGAQRIARQDRPLHPEADRSSTRPRSAAWRRPKACGTPAAPACAKRWRRSGKAPCAASPPTRRMRIDARVAAVTAVQKGAEIVRAAYELQWRECGAQIRGAAAPAARGQLPAASHLGQPSLLRTDGPRSLRHRPAELSHLARGVPIDKVPVHAH